MAAELGQGSEEGRRGGCTASAGSAASLCLSPDPPTFLLTTMLLQNSTICFSAPLEPSPWLASILTASPEYSSLTNLPYNNILVFPWTPKSLTQPVFPSKHRQSIPARLPTASGAPLSPPHVTPALSHHARSANTGVTQAGGRTPPRSHSPGRCFYTCHIKSCEKKPKKTKEKELKFKETVGTPAGSPLPCTDASRAGD